MSNRCLVNGTMGMRDRLRDTQECELEKPAVRSTAGETDTTLLEQGAL